MDTVRFEGARRVRVTAQAIVVEVEGGRHLVPNSVICESSEVRAFGPATGILVVERWFADKEGIGADAGVDGSGLVLKRPPSSRARARITPPKLQRTRRELQKMRAVAERCNVRAFALNGELYTGALDGQCVALCDSDDDDQDAANAMFLGRARKYVIELIEDLERYRAWARKVTR